MTLRRSATPLAPAADNSSSAFAVCNDTDRVCHATPKTTDRVSGSDGATDRMKVRASALAAQGFQSKRDQVWTRVAHPLPVRRPGGSSAIPISPAACRL